jgi:hypothetical protein
MDERTLDARQIGEAMLLLERLTRDCFETVRDYWQKPKTNPDIEYRIMENAVRDAIAKSLSEILVSVLSDGSGRVFFAPRYRGAGVLKEEPEVRSQPVDIHKLEPFHRYTDNFGCLAERGELARISYLMPAAFWNYHIYEIPLIFQDAATLRTKKVRLSGFSGWTAEHGFLEYSSDLTKAPVCGFHFTFDGKQIAALSSAQFRGGFLDITFPRDTHCFDVTAAFRNVIYDGRLAFCSGGTSQPKFLTRNSDNGAFDPPFPIISGSGTPLQGLDSRVAEAIFSALFYSNFRELPSKQSADWNSILTSLGLSSIVTDGPVRSFADIGAVLFDLYQRSVIKAAEDNAHIVTFPHYYAFLLNRSLEFKSSRHLQAAAIGTLNLHTDIALPPPLPSLIRKNLESIYHFLRVLEDWEDATREGQETSLDLMNNAMGHEVVKVYSTAKDLLTAQRRHAVSPDCDFIYDIIEMTLEYGKLWGSASDVKFPEEATLWDESGIPFESFRYVASWVRQSWYLFLTTDVFRGLNRPLTSDDRDKVSTLWSATEQLLNIVFFEKRAKLAFPPSFVSGQSQRMNLSRSLYRWMMAVMSNAWKHLVSMSDTRVNSLDNISIPARLNLVIKALASWNRVGYTAESAPLSVIFTSNEKGVVATVSNISTQSAKQTATKLEGTFLVMVMAGQDIWRAQGEACSIELLKNNMRFELDSPTTRWISTIPIPNVIIDMEEPNENPSL